MFACAPGLFVPTIPELLSSGSPHTCTAPLHPVLRGLEGVNSLRLGATWKHRYQRIILRLLCLHPLSVRFFYGFLNTILQSLGGSRQAVRDVPQQEAGLCPKKAHSGAVPSLPTWNHLDGALAEDSLNMSFPRKRRKSVYRTNPRSKGLSTELLGAF